MHLQDSFALPHAGGCDLGTRTIEPHMVALRRFGLDVKVTGGFYRVVVDRSNSGDRSIVLTERGDTATEDVLMAAARERHHGDPQRQPELHGAGSLPLPDQARRRDRGHRHHDAAGTRHPRIDCDIDYSPSEDPVEAMSMLAAAIVTGSEITVRRAPIEFLEIELVLLEEMGLRYDRGPEYVAVNGFTRLVDLRPVPLDAEITDRQDSPDAVPRPQHRQPPVLRGHRRERARLDPDPRLGL